MRADVRMTSQGKIIPIGVNDHVTVLIESKSMNDSKIWVQEEVKQLIVIPIGLLM